ncbi:MAG TPA: ABC transporter permease [Ktedonobacteraceae bacterium]|nr:ABC transporter permease [Ktedonobacteraceae bacterium]
MHTRTILAIARKDAIDIVKNKQALIGLLTPFIMGIVFIFLQVLFSGRGVLQVYIYDPDHSNISQIASSVFDKPEIVYARSADDVSAEFGSDGARKSTKYAMGLIVPSGFENSVRQGQHPQVTLYMDANRMSSSQRLAVPGLLADYANTIANPVPPVAVRQSTINPPVESYTFDASTLNTVYPVVAIMFSLYTSLLLVPTLLIEEKEKKTIRMLMVSPASFTDIVLGKSLVALIYQLIFTLALLGIVVMGGHSGNIALLVPFILLGSGLYLALGLLFGCIFKTTTAANGVGGGIGSMLILLPALLVGPFGQLVLGNSSIGQVLKVLPTYYIADALYVALLNQDKLGSILLDAGVLCACIVALFALAVWALRRQAAVAAEI